MSTQQDIYATGFESRPPMLNKENYVPWSSRLFRYAKSRPNGKLIHNSIINGPYVRRMIPEPGDANREVIVTETFHVKTDDELTEKELKQIEADDQAIQTILLGSDIGIQEKKAKLFNEWERFTSNEGESIESYYHRFLKLMNDLKNKHFPEKIASNLKFLNSLQPEWSRHVTIIHQTKDLHTADYTQLYDFLKYNRNEVDELKAKRLAKTQDPLALMYGRQNVRNLNWYNAVQNVKNQNLNGNGNLVAARAERNAAGKNRNQIRCYNCRGVGHYARNCTVKPRRRDAAYLQTQLLIAQKKEAGIQLQAEKFDLMAVAADLDEIEEVNANCILMVNLQQASTSGTQSDKAPVYDSDGSAEVHDYENYDDKEIFNMFTQEEKYTELLEPISESYQVPQNDNVVISEVTSVEQGIKVEKVNSVNRKLKETNADLTTELARFKNKKKEQCLSKKINALHLSTGKQIMTLNEQISDLNKQLSKEKSIVSSLLEEKKKLKSDFKTPEDKLLDKQIQLKKRIKELNNILVKTGQSIQTIHMLSPKPDSFYHTEQKMDLGYQNPFYLKQAQKKQQSLYDGKMLLEKHDPPIVYDSEETLQLAQESHKKMKQLNKEIKLANYTKINYLSRVKTTIVTLQRVVKHIMTIEPHNWSSSAHQELHKIIKDENFPIVNQVDARVQNFKIQFLKEATKFVGDFKSLANKADESLVKHKALELEIERLLKAVVSHDIMNIVQKESVVDTSDLQTELECTKERFENCIIKKENKYAKLWNDWYKKCDECKYGKISYDKAYKDMHQKIEQLQAQLGDLKGKSKDTSCVSDTLNPLSHKLENANVELEFQALNYARENAHLKTTYKNLFDSIYLRAQLFNKVSDQKDNKRGTSKNTKFAKQSILGKPPMLDEIHSLSKPVTSNSDPTPQESKVVKNNKVITPRIFMINPFKTSREEKHVPNTVRVSTRTKPITVSQPPVFTKKDVNSDSNGLSSTGVDNTKTRRPQPKRNTKNNRVPSASKSSRSKNKEVKVEEHPRNLLLSKNNKHMSSACNNIKLDSQNVISKDVCAMCKKYLISVNHDIC
nr:hypothetical protein [Tanacetum cinerariifolium]